MKARWIADAKQDRADIVGYIAVENPRAALKMDDLFGEAANKLGEFPKLGRMGKIPGTRELIPRLIWHSLYPDQLPVSSWSR